MIKLTLRETKGTELTHSEVDTNFINLKNSILEDLTKINESSTINISKNMIIDEVLENIYSMNSQSNYEFGTTLIKFKSKINGELYIRIKE